MTNQARLADNAVFCVKCARQMRRAIRSRLAYGDVNRVAVALEHLARAASFPDVPHLLTFLETCDASAWLSTVMSDWVETSRDYLKIATGADRATWLGLVHDHASTLEKRPCD